MKSTICYTHVSIPNGHFRVLSGTMDMSGWNITLIHGADSTAPGEKVFGVRFSDLRTCNCGRWRWPKSSVVKVEGGKHRFSVRGRNT